MPTNNAKKCTHVSADGTILESENCSVEPERYWDGLHVIGTFRTKAPGGEWEEIEGVAWTLPTTGTVVQWK